MTPFSTSSYDPTWGDEFGSDSWDSLLAVRDWDDICADDMVRLYPRLLPRNGEIPHTVANRVAECIAVLAWRLEPGRDKRFDVPLSSIHQTEVERIGRTKAATWFPDQPRRWLHLSKRTDFWTSRAEDLDALRFLDSLLAEIQAQAVRSYRAQTAAELAFRTGVHPVYIWPEALLSHQLFTTVGWLGHVARGRRVRMPHDIAEYLSEVLRDDDTGVICVDDANLDYYLTCTGIKHRLRSCARRRLRGLPVVFHSEVATGVRRSTTRRLIPGATRIESFMKDRSGGDGAVG